MENFFYYSIFGNNVSTYLLVICLIIALFSAKYFIENSLFKTMHGTLQKKAPSLFKELEDIFNDSFKKYVATLFYLAIALIVNHLLAFPEKAHTILESATFFLFIVSTTRLALRWGIHVLKSRQVPSKADALVHKTIVNVVYATVWGIVALFLLNNLGFNISAIIAGLGIGGIAIALAAQTILGDLFNYFVILFDGPFNEGDLIQVGELKGHVQNVGIKTTRLLALSGEEVIFPNSHLTSQSLRNISRLKSKRIILALSIDSQTEVSKLEKMPKLIRSAVESTPNTRFDRANWLQFGTSGLDYEIVYYVLSQETKVQTAAQELVNLGIMKALLEENIALSTLPKPIFVQTIKESI